MNLNEPVNMFGDTLLHYACKNNDLEVVKYIIEKQPGAQLKPNIRQKLPIHLCSD